MTAMNSIAMNMNADAPKPEVNVPPVAPAVPQPAKSAPSSESTVQKSAGSK